MHCPSCGSPFNNTEHTPRIFVACGHTICQYCLEDFLSSSPVFCPECNTVQPATGINSFPKNLALISMETYSRKEADGSSSGAA